MKMSKKEVAGRCVLLVVGLFFSALGVALTRHAELGVSPISSVANVLSLRFTRLTLGNWLIIWNCILILGQILILRKKFRIVQFLQVPLSFLFGWFTDLGVWIVSGLSADSYPARLVMVLVGTVVLGFGVCISVIANLIMNSGEAFVKAISDTVQKPFGNVKVVFDVSCVVTAVLLSLLLFRMRIVGTREGTVLAALLTGVVVRFFDGKLRAPLERLVSGR